jgi:hypothetical protein
METEPSQEEWIMFYNELSVAVEQGRLNSSDSAFIRQIKNLKQARFIMANRERVNERKASQIRQQEQEFQMQVAQQADDNKTNREMAILDKKKQDEMELLEIKARIDDAMLTKKVMLEGEVNKVSDMVAQQIEKQKGIDTILKETIRAKSESYKSDKKFQADVIKANKSQETSIVTKQMEKDKPKKKA